MVLSGIIVRVLRSRVIVFFFFKDTAPPEIYPLPLPDALPISSTTSSSTSGCCRRFQPQPTRYRSPTDRSPPRGPGVGEILDLYRRTTTSALVRSTDATPSPRQKV